MEFFIQHIYPWLRWTAAASPAVPLFFGFWLVGKNRSPYFWLLYGFVTISVMTEAAAFIIIWLGTKNNIWMVTLYTVFSFSVLAVIFYRSFDKVSWKRAVLVGILVLIALIYYDAFYLEDGLKKLNSLSRVSANAMLIMMAIAYFYKVANDAKVVYLDRDAMFLLSCAVLVYYAGTSMSYALFNEALAISYDAARICLATKMILTIFFYISLVFILRRMAA